MISLNIKNSDNELLLLSYAFFMGISISKIAYGANTVWERVSSCFGSGTWMKDKTWSSTETWKSN